MMKILHRNKTFLSALFCFLAIASLSLTAPAPALAEDDGAGEKPDRWYLTLGIGRTWDIDQTDGLPFDHRDEGILKFEIGLTFFKYFAVELGVINFGKLESVFNGAVVVGGVFYPGPHKFKEDIGGATATVIWHVPIYKKGSKVVTFFVKGGVFRWSNKLKVRVAPLLDGVAKTDGTDPTASVGFQVRGEGKSAFRFEVQRFETDDKEINTAFINFVYYY